MGWTLAWIHFTAAAAAFAYGAWPWRARYWAEEEVLRFLASPPAPGSGKNSILPPGRTAATLGGIPHRAMPASICASCSESPRKTRRLGIFTVRVSPSIVSVVGASWTNPDRSSLYRSPTPSDNSLPPPRCPGF